MQAEPLLPSSLPDRPWERLATDLFELNGKTYLAIVDYYSRWLEVKLLNKTTSSEIINNVKSVFAAHGIPDIMMSDNGPQFSSAEFAQFAKSYGFTHVTSSPRFPQANGEAERAVQTLKTLMKKNKDPYIALLMYRATPLQNGVSPAEMLMGRKLRTKIPVIQTNLKPKIPDHNNIQKKEAIYKQKQKVTFDQRHRAREQPAVHPGDSVFIKDMQTHGNIISSSNSPRSYIIATPRGTIRRNRSAIVHTQGLVNFPNGNPDKPTQMDTACSPQTPLQQPKREDTGYSTPTRPTVQQQPKRDDTGYSTPTRPTTEQLSRYGRKIIKPNKLNL